jgi:hypothetical protein
MNNEKVNVIVQDDLLQIKRPNRHARRTQAAIARKIARLVNKANKAK